MIEEKTSSTDTSPIGFIYLITNSVNEKRYVGQTAMNPPVKRWHDHLKCARIKVDGVLYDAIRKHGPEAFKFEVIEECSESELNDREVFWIREHKTFAGAHKNLGYNQTEGGRYGIRGYHHTPETCKQISDSLSGDKNPFFGRHHSPETCEVLRQRSTGKKASAETRKKQSDQRRGKKANPETVAKIAAINTGKSRTPEQCRNISEGKKRGFLASGKVKKKKWRRPNQSFQHSVVCTDSSGSTMRYRTITQASDDLNIPRTTIRYALKYSVMCGNRSWSYEEPPPRVRTSDTSNSGNHARPVVQLTIDYDVIAVHKTTKAAALAVGCTAPPIRSCCLGRLHTVKGYKWVFKDEFDLQEDYSF